ncbi:hypothetical protein DNU06_00080 [Putridiphycobacter roseus]|uniref:CAAX prenyl protease 2/Lysostaphin resistance protein A-like domain-containing protein n=1 Tax=Putridiphycobacter roseus TaxID=2219161 RepID=A0A2W1NU25_9FLAO|nr:CPBP family intramembrane glutamic endopeptidase [Putridiphycobacter roseus]PZE18268.1 hypothetical protein DNU06_00080 [Putridiphycobacter roseus]
MIKDVLKSQLTVMGLITLIGFPLLAWPLLYFQNISWRSLFEIAPEDYFQIPLYLSIGIGFGIWMIWLSEKPYFEKGLGPIKDRFTDLNLTTFHVFFLAIAAGVGEEVFFRGAIQPYEGVWSTAIIFVAIHGYFSFQYRTINLLAIFLTAFIVLIGFAAKNESLWLAVAAHFSYDLVLLFYYKNN